MQFTLEVLMLKIEFKAMVLSNKSGLILKHYAVTKTKNR